MKRSTITLLFWSAIAYAAILLVARGILPPDSTPSTSLVAIPLVIIVIILILDMARRSTISTETIADPTKETFRGRQVQFLSRQIYVTAEASASYFDEVVRGRLIELLITKASLESGLERETVLQVLSDHKKGSKFLHDDALYKLLYSAAPEKGRARLEMVKAAVDHIEAWNP